ncbi:MAG: MBOAT family protein [Clostridia bacterium]|nr:MBOAT family protein [Clostridia bacterium]
MVFSGLPFIYFFLPAALVLGLTLPVKGRNAAILLLSLFFYAYGEPRCLPLLVLAAVSAWGFGLWAEHMRGRKFSRLPLLCSCVLSLGLLVYFKYADFLLGTLRSLGAGVSLLHIVLPIGISFYTFQATSYVADVTRGDVPAERSLIDFAAYLTFFPQLIAGPIVRYSDVQEQMKVRNISLERFADGAVRFSVGLGKKVLIANVLAECTADFAAAETPSVLFYLLYAVCNALNIYFDFSGYSDMAIGLGMLFGFEFPENFRHPFASRSAAEFWRRWHMTLGTWFRDYVYIPLGGSRCSLGKQIRNLLIVWALTGLWHGAAWNYVLWGLYFGVFLILERLFLGKWLENAPGFVGHVYVVAVTLVSFLLFSAANPLEAVSQLCGMLGLNGVPLWNGEALYALKSCAVILICALIGAVPTVPFVVNRLRTHKSGDALCAVLRPVVTAALLLASTAFLVAGSFNPFLYWQF